MLMTDKQREDVAARFGMTADELREAQYRAAYKRTGTAYEYKCSECDNLIRFKPSGKFKQTCCDKCRKRRTRRLKKVLDNAT